MRSIYFLLALATAALNSSAFGQSPPASTDLGVIGPAGTFVFNRELAGISYDPETICPEFADVAMFDSSGNLLGEADATTDLSLNLADGEYYLALGFASSSGVAPVFGDGFEIISYDPFSRGFADYDYISYDIEINTEVYSGDFLNGQLANNPAVFRVEVKSVVLGDADLSGDVDFGDIPAFISVLQSGLFQAEADCNENGMVDFGDISAFIDILIGS